MCGLQERPRDTLPRRHGTRECQETGPHTPSAAPEQNTRGGTLHLMLQKPVLRRAGPLLPCVCTTDVMARSRAPLSAVLAPASATLRETHPNHKPSHLRALSSLGAATTQCISRCSASAVTAPPILEHCERPATQHQDASTAWQTGWSIYPSSLNHAKCLLVPTTRWCRRVLPSGWLCSQVTFPGGHQGRNEGLGLHLPSPQRHSAPQSPTQHNSTKPAVLLVIKNNKNFSFNKFGKHIRIAHSTGKYGEKITFPVIACKTPKISIPLPGIHL